MRSRHRDWAIMQIQFRYIIEDRDRHGNIRVYVRVPGRRKVRIRAPFGTDKFIAAYNAAISEHVSAPRQARAAKTGSFRHVCVLYYASATFKRLDPATQSWRRRRASTRHHVCPRHHLYPTAQQVSRARPRRPSALVGLCTPPAIEEFQRPPALGSRYAGVRAGFEARLVSCGRACGLKGGLYGGWYMS